MGVAATSVAVEMKMKVDPRDLGATAWWKADTLDPLLADNAAVGTWPDSSGNGRDLTQATASLKPVLRKNFAPGGYSYVDFDGVDDTMATTATIAQLLGASGVGTIFMVFNQQFQLAPDDTGMLIWTSGSVRFYVDVVAGVQTVVAYNNDGAADTVSKSIALDSWAVCNWGHNGTTLYIGRNDTSDAGRGSVASGATVNTSNTLAIGVVGLEFWGRVAEIIVFPTYLTAAQRDQVQYYLEVKYGLTGLTYENKSANSNPWTDISGDITADGIQVKYGIQGNSQLDRVASAGTMHFKLINSRGNAAKVAGYYSPDSASARRIGFDFGVPCRLKIAYGGTTYYKFAGVVDSIVPVPGKVGLVSDVTVVDWMDEAARAQVSGIPVQISKRADQIFSTLLTKVTLQPNSTSIDTSSDTYAAALDNTRDEGQISILTEFQRLAASELGYIYVKGDTTAGGKLVFEGRRSRANSLTNAATFGDSTLWAMGAGRARKDMINRVLVRVHPRRIDAAATTVLCTVQFSDNSARFVGRGQLIVPFLIPYRDPLQLDVRIGGTEIVAPVAGTDFTFNTAADGTGTNITSQLAVTVTDGGNQAVFNVTNNGPYDGYITLLQVRGKGVYSFEDTVITAEDTASQALYGNNSQSFDMPYQNVVAVGLDTAYFLLNRGKTPYTQVDAIRFLANDSDTLMTNALSLEISDRIGLSETQTGIDASTSPRGFFINAVQLDIRNKNQIWCTWTLIPTDQERAWILGDTTYGVMDSTTRLGFGIFT